ncbi:MAG TPA: extracellular solute-binding protein [Planctomycetota bacterium]|nr:extracellular solute-binding protein [Planctomycetota bacterium]
MINPRFVVVIVLALAAIAAALLLSAPAIPKERAVVVYTSVDAEYALPLFERFEKESGIKVVARTDGEATKTTGMAEQLLQRKDNPDGDVFWNSELSFTQLLADKGALEPYISPAADKIPAHFKHPDGLWTGFGCRARVLVYNTQKVTREELPKSLEDLSLPRWKGKFAVAKPLFGTTRSHLVALVLALGEEKAFALFRAWRENGVVIAESNGDVRNRVADGTFEIGLTDTDDVISAMERNKPVNFTIPQQTRAVTEAFLIPNTVAILKGCKHPAEARAFVDYLLRPETEAWLAENGARQIPVRDVGAKIPDWMHDIKPLQVDARELAAKVLPLGERIYRVLLGEEK